MPNVRRAGYADLSEILAVQRSSAEAAQWEPAIDSAYDLLVVEIEGCIAGFLAGRTVCPGEHEILNLAVNPDYRRRGAARSLLAAWLSTRAGQVFLEVRESNTAARNLYKSMGFQEVAIREKYYSFPLETAIVLRFHSC